MSARRSAVTRGHLTLTLGEEAEKCAQALFKVISQVGIPKEILTDQGTAFMSRTLKELNGKW